MKALSFLLLSLGGTCLAATAPTFNATSSHTVQSLEADATNISFTDTVITRGYGGKNQYYEWGFDFWYEEYCGTDSEHDSKPLVMARGDLFTSHRNHNTRTFQRDIALTFPLDNSTGESLHVFHDYENSQIQFTYEDCKWRNYQWKNCGSCNNQAPWHGNGQNGIDCKSGKELTRHRTIRCIFQRRRKPAKPILSISEQPRLPPPTWGIRGVFARDKPTQPAVDENVVVATLDVPFEAPARKTHEQAPDDGNSANLYYFSISFSEYCDKGALKARGWLGNGQINFELTLNPTQVTKINLHPGYDLIAGPYNFDSHYFGIAYDGCRWSTEGGYPCGWCELQSWTLGPLNCQTGQPGNQRLTHRTCYFIDNHMHGQIAGRAIQSEATSTEDIAFKPASSTTAHPHPHPTDSPEPPTATSQSNDTNIVEIAGASTLTLMPAIIQTRTPTTPYAQNDIILPFHLHIWEYCLDGTRLAHGIYTNGNMKQSISLRQGLVTSINHRVPGYANLEMGPFDYGVSRVRFRYSRGDRGECEWFDDQTWKSCGECRAGLWSKGPLDCRDARAVRYKDMDCSVLLGVSARERDTGTG